MQTENRNREKCCLVVLDGWGENEENNPEIVDAIVQANPCHMNKLRATYFSTLLLAHGTYVGLASNSNMGNSEVGHLTIGAGRTVLQDSVRIRKVLSGDLGSDEQTSVLSNLFDSLVANQIVHVLGMLSDGNIHSHWRDILDIATLISPKCQAVYIHSIADGRDTRPSEYLNYLAQIKPLLPANAYIVSVSGRFYAMDRDKREERTAATYDTLFSATKPTQTPSLPNYTEITSYIEQQYAQNITDEFIPPFCLPGCQITPQSPLLITNFRVDRVRQIYAKLAPVTQIHTMTRVLPDQKNEEVLFERPEIKQTLGDVIEEQGLRQVRIAETEKAAHVTFFFDGGKDINRQNSLKRIIPSQRVESYDTTPAMSAPEVTKAVLDEIKQGTDFVLVNFANGDMVGHTGNISATKQAISVLDQHINEIYLAAKEHNYLLIITADHGNAEVMQDAQGPVKSHTTNKVPIIIISPSTQASVTTSKSNPSLADVAPTVLRLMNLPIPDAMTGHSLIN
ncbi:2,3-bisphosphoglycerate-independent phosphoglycerate mutase [Nematocida homosporus]|uniref:2,3-bisphosphoglycerate-independent phosphoglycerate mutase n=1 Tax=Nematocida homosporus TaxID=1912981 RepID=UPI00221FAE51|nr:2,3-bisphosphoglycerate-independent phosphoglycerate mutase [Nematocida homosporus]KAI5184773.1 2,3-bisphosphoglycerate-independent phosphoglycerate mutase [Nematocida homosporus]